jgi:hypothetical protein
MHGHQKTVYGKLEYLPAWRDEKVAADQSPGSGDEYINSVRNIIKRIRAEAKEGVGRSQEPLEKIKIKQVDPWMIENAKKAGIDIEGYAHEISNYFIHHVIKNHGKEKTEVIRGNLPITDEDFEEILRGKSNRSLRGRTMYKTKKNLDKNAVLINISMNRKTNLSNIKIASMDGD